MLSNTSVVSHEKRVFDAVKISSGCQPIDIYYIQYKYIYIIIFLVLVRKLFLTILPVTFAKYLPKEDASSYCGNSNVLVAILMPPVQINNVMSLDVYPIDGKYPFLFIIITFKIKFDFKKIWCCIHWIYQLYFYGRWYHPYRRRHAFPSLFKEEGQYGYSTFMRLYYS